MDKFIASNGCAVWRDNKGELQLEGEAFDYLYREHDVAAREYFQHERDQELGRWRWPENPDYVVYPKEESETEPLPGVRVVHEKTGRLREITGRVIGACDATLSQFGRAARAYFEAHPGPKPWHDAKDGQLWLIRFDDYPEADVSALVKDGRFVYNDHCHEGTAELFDMTIITGRRIWPEASND